MHRLLGMRWWLGLAFACVAGFTAVAVVEILNERSARAFRSYAEDVAIGRSVMAAERLSHDRTAAAVYRDAQTLATVQLVRLYALDANGRLVSPPVSRGVPWSAVPSRADAVAVARTGKRFISGRGGGAEYVVGLPIHGGAGAVLVTYTRQQGLRAVLGIIRNEYLQAALWASLGGALLGLAVATLTARRLRRIARAASAIGGGRFDTEVASRFPDEVGSLALSIERMRRQLQELFLALERDRDRLDRLLDRLDDGVVVVNRRFQVEFANDRARELLGVDGVLPDGDLRGLAGDLFDTGAPSVLRLSDGQRTLEISGIPPGQGGENAIVVVHDRTQAERNERVQREFATNAAHELRTPLASIVTSVEMLQTGAKDDPEARDDFLETIARESARLTRLTRALLVLARADAGDEPPRRAHVEVAPLLRQVAAALRARPGVGVAVECPPSLAIAGDPDLLEQALSSVAANAIEHTDAGSIVLRGRERDGAVVLEVADTGRGIPARDRQRVFERFYRAGGRDGGFGLGLAIARQAVGALGGEIEVESKVGVGTTVRITLARAAIPV